MMNSFFIKPYLFLLVFSISLLRVSLYGQCSGCTTTYASNSGANMTIVGGQTICVNSGVTLSGQVTLNGGVLCNNGTVNNLRLNAGRGRVNNYGIIKANETSITPTGNLLIYCYTASQFTFTGSSLVVSTCDSIYFNLNGTAKVSFVSDLSISSTNNSKKLSVVNGGGIFNVGNNFNVNNAALSLSNNTGGVFNVSGSLNLTNTGNKKLYNAGTLNIYNALNIGGNGSSSTSVLVSNSGYLPIVHNLECTMTNGNFYLNNTSATAQGITIGDELLLSTTTSTTINDGLFSAGGSITSNGIVINNGGLSSELDVLIDDGNFMNNHYLNVANDFRNSAAVQLGLGSMIKTANYYHDAGSITGPSHPNGIGEYANILITGLSQNSASIDGYIVVNDTSLVCTEANKGIGFEVNTGVIGSGILFAQTSIGIDFIPIRHCAGYAGRYIASAASSPGGTTDYGTAVSLSGQLTEISFAIGPFGPYYLPVTTPPPVYVWQPTNQTGQNVNVTPPSTQVFTVTAYYNGCPFTSMVTVNVREIIYTVLSRDLNGGFCAPLSNNKLYFKYDNEYRNNTVLNYKIYKPDRTLLTTCTFNTLQSNYGDNRFSITIPSCLPSPGSQYYTLEVQNEKKELFYLKFKY